MWWMSECKLMLLPYFQFLTFLRYAAFFELFSLDYVYMFIFLCVSSTIGTSIFTSGLRKWFLLKVQVSVVNNDTSFVKNEEGLLVVSFQLYFGSYIKVGVGVTEWIVKCNLKPIIGVDKVPWLKETWFPMQINWKSWQLWMYDTVSGIKINLHNS